MPSVLRFSPSGPAASVGGDVPPFSTLKYVDPATLVPLADQDGSVSSPYSTIQGAIDANLGAPLALALVGSAYPENVVVPAGFVLLLVCGNNTATSLTLGPSASVVSIAGGLVLEDLTMGDGSVFTAGSFLVVSNSVVVGNGCVIESLLSINVTGTFTFGDSMALRCFNFFSFPNAAGLVANLGAAPSNLLFMGSSTAQFANIAPLAPSVNATGSHVGIVGAQNTTGTGYVCTTLAIDSCQILGGPLTCDTFKCNASVAAFGAVSTTGPVEITNSQVSSTAPPWANALATPFALDAYSNYWLKTSGTTLTNVGEKVIANDLVP
jgi:hypothetical protein